MPTPHPINAVQTRVVKDAQGCFRPQFSSDGLSWSPLPCRDIDQETAIATCNDFMIESRVMPHQGEVVWRSSSK